MNKVLINLVNKEGKRIGSIEKIEAHKSGELHEAFSIFIFNSRKELLLQKRNPSKYHSGGLWSNTCCSHAQVDEQLNDATHRRLKEEMGFDCEMREVYSFVYKVSFDNGLIENEFDHIFIGLVDSVIVKPNPEEVSGYSWIGLDDLEKNIGNCPQEYTEWLKIALRSYDFNSVL